MIDNIELVRRVQLGDGSSLEQLWRQNRGFLYTVAKRYTPRAWADLDDLLQCAYIGLHRAALNYREQCAFLTLVQYAVMRECRNMLSIGRAHSVDAPFSTDALAEDGETPFIECIEDRDLPPIDAGVELEALQEAVRNAVDALPERERSIVARHWFDGLTMEEIAEQDACSRERVRQIEQRAFGRLRQDRVLSTLYAPPERTENPYRGRVDDIAVERADRAKRREFRAFERGVWRSVAEGLYSARTAECIIENRRAACGL